MAKLVIIYDSNTGNTEKMAESIAEGAKSVSNVDVILKKIGEPFSLSNILDDADAVILGSPAHYAYATPEMSNFLSSIQGLVEERSLILKEKLGAAFGSYGWDGAKSIQRLAMEMDSLGFKMQYPTLAKTSLLPMSNLREKVLNECRKLGKDIAEQISKTS